MNKIIIVFAVVILVGCSGLRKANYTPEISGATPVEMACVITENTASCNISFTEEGERIKEILKSLCLVLGGDSSKCVFDL